MGQKAEINGTGYDLKAGKCLSGGTAYAIKKGRMLKDGTGYDISLSSGTPISELPVGSIVKIVISGTLKDFLIVHQGLPSSLYDSSCNGTWLLMKDVYENRAWNSANVNDYANSTIHSYLNSTFLGLFESNIQNAIKQVKIPFVNGTSNSAVASGANGLSTKVFLLSSYEVGTPSSEDGVPTDGAVLGYFATWYDNSLRVAYLNGVATNWWLRSPYTLDARYVRYIHSQGNYYNGMYPTMANGIRPALVFLSDTLVSDDGAIVI